MELLGLIIFASLFVYSGYKHVRYHPNMADNTAAVFGDCPVAKQLGYLGGWPTGLFLIIFGAGMVVNESSVFAYGLAAFLAVATLLFHRNTLADPGTQKGIALIGAALYIASQV